MPLASEVSEELKGEVEGGAAAAGSPPDDDDAAAAAAVAAAVAAARGKLVYVGSAGGLESKRALASILREARQAALPSPCRDSSDRGGVSDGGGAGAIGSPPALVVFGSGWRTEGGGEWADVWGGVLPHSPGALERVYGAAFAVLGATMDDQREYGMVSASEGGDKAARSRRHRCTSLPRGDRQRSLDLSRCRRSRASPR